MSREKIVEQVSRYAPGLTWRSFLAILYGIFILMPALIFLNCATGQTVSVWILVLLWVELARLFGGKLSRQELFIMLIPKFLDDRIKLEISSIMTYFYITDDIKDEQ